MPTTNVIKVGNEKSGRRALSANAYAFGGSGGGGKKTPSEACLSGLCESTPEPCIKPGIASEIGGALLGLGALFRFAFGFRVTALAPEEISNSGAESTDFFLTLVGRALIKGCDLTRV